MFEKWTRKIAGKVTDSAAEGMKKSFNDRMDQYGDIIQIGLVLGVIIIGGRHLTKRRRDPQETYIPYQLPAGSPPVVINNYYREREERRYEQRNKRRNQWLENGQVQQGGPAQTVYPQRKNRR